MQYTVQLCKCAFLTWAVKAIEVLTIYLILVPEGPPQNVTVESLNSTSIRVRWSPVPRPLSNGNIRGYQVAYVVSDVPISRTHIISTYEGELSKVRENQILVSHLKVSFCPISVADA